MEKKEKRKAPEHAMSFKRNAGSIHLMRIDNHMYKTPLPRREPLNGNGIECEDGKAGNKLPNAWKGLLAQRAVSGYPAR